MGIIGIFCDSVMQGVFAHGHYRDILRLDNERIIYV